MRRRTLKAKGDLGLPCWISPSDSSIIGRGQPSTRRMWPEEEERRERQVNQREGDVLFSWGCG